MSERKTISVLELHVDPAVLQAEDLSYRVHPGFRGGSLEAVYFPQEVNVSYGWGCEPVSADPALFKVRVARYVVFVAVRVDNEVYPVLLSCLLSYFRLEARVY